MSSMVVALVLFGCADDGSLCERLATQPRYYESRVLCEAEVGMALQSDVALRADYPLVVARCVSSGALAALDRGWLDPSPVHEGPSLYSR